MTEEKVFTTYVSVRTSPETNELQRRDFYGEDLGSYMVLREVLDVFQRRMVEYFLAGETAKERAARADEIRLAISEVPNPVWASTPVGCNGDGDCPPGQRCVNGVCQDGADVPPGGPDTEAIATQTVGSA
jgi:hypothetical protein